MIRFTKGIDYTFQPNTILDAGGYLVLVSTTNHQAFRDHYGLDGSVALVGPNGYQRIHCEQVTVQFGSLSKPEIERYIAIERPLDTAGAFKVECLGISLFDSVTSRDPTALEGLPLITISQWCRDLGLQVP